MSMNLRRIVTGHDGEGNSVIEIDEVTSNIVSRRPGHSSSIVWTAASVPADNNLAMDEAMRDVSDCAAQGVIFRVIDYAPGVASRMHRTMTVDYAVVMAGEIDMMMDNGKSVHLRAGDVIVQRGTVHDWINHGTVACRIAFVLIAAKPVETKNGPLGLTG